MNNFSSQRGGEEVLSFPKDAPIGSFFVLLRHNENVSPYRANLMGNYLLNDFVVQHTLSVTGLLVTPKELGITLITFNKFNLN